MLLVALCKVLRPWPCDRQKSDALEAFSKFLLLVGFRIFHSRLRLTACQCSKIGMNIKKKLLSKASTQLEQIRIVFWPENLLEYSCCECLFFFSWSPNKQNQNNVTQSISEHTILHKIMTVISQDSLSTSHYSKSEIISSCSFLSMSMGYSEATWVPLEGLCN